MTSEQLGASIGQNRHAIDNPRRGASKPTIELVERLIAAYPDSEPHFATNAAQYDEVHDSIVMYSDGRAWKELAETQKKYIEALEHRIAKQDEEMRDLKAENKYLHQRVQELEKKI